MIGPEDCDEIDRSGARSASPFAFPRYSLIVQDLICYQNKVDGMWMVCSIIREMP
jgi:hypothetical protein